MDGLGPLEEFAFHHLSWTDFDALARGECGAAAVRRLRRAERSRRLLLLRALADEIAKASELSGPLPSPDTAWELLARVERRSRRTFNRMIDHPYTGSWAGYTIRLLRNGVGGVCPLWIHAGHLCAIAAAAGIRAGLDFEIDVPMWDGGAILPSLGMARLPADSPYSVATVRARNGEIEVGHAGEWVRLPSKLDEDGLGWWCVRRVSALVGRHRLSIALDDVDPYRGLYEPIPPRRRTAAEIDAWRVLLAAAWPMIVEHLPHAAHGFPVGLDSVVPGTTVPFRDASASTGEAFGSAVIARPADAVSLAATLAHEFHHIVLGGVLHLVQLHDDDPRERFYVPWRDDSRPVSRVLQGVYAFFGVTALWRGLFRAGSGGRRAAFEFSHWRGQTWRALAALRADEGLTPAGQRFAAGIAARLGPWLAEPLPADVTLLADAVATDHHAGWRIRHLRPHADVVAELAGAWLAGRSRPPRNRHPAVSEPTPVSDGPWSRARADLIRLALAGTGAVAESWSSVPDATGADVAYATGRFAEATLGYRSELAADPDRPASWVGLGLALAAQGTGPAVRALLHHPELVRAVYRKVSRTKATDVPAPDQLAAWIGQSLA